MFVETLQQNVTDLIGIGIVSNADHNVDAAELAGMCPVGNRLRDERGVWNDNGCAIKGLYLR